MVVKFFWILIILFHYQAFAFASSSTEIEEKLNNIVKDLMIKDKVVGVSIAVLRKGNKDLVFHLGHRDIEENLAPNDDTIYEIGSISKTFTRLSIALQDQVKLDDSISLYLPPTVRNPLPAGEEIKIEDLLTHMGIKFSVPCIIRANNPEGLKCFGVDLDPNLTDPYRNTSRDLNYSFLNEFSYTVDEFPDLFPAPGNFYSYSNIGMGLLGEILAEAHGQSFEAFIKDRVLIPLGLRNTYVEMKCEESGTCKNLSKVYSKGEISDKWQESNLWHMPGIPGAGALRSSLSDMKRYLRANLYPSQTSINDALVEGQKLLKSATKRHNSNICSEDNKKNHCNLQKRYLFHSWESVSPETVLYHGGATGSSQSMIMFSTDRSMGVVVLSNSKIGKGEQTLFHLPNDLALCIFELYGKPVVQNYSFCQKAIE